MKRTKQWNWLWSGLLVTMLLTLTACGGGGGGSDTPAAPSSALSVAQTALLFTATVEGGANPAPQTFMVANTGSAATTLVWTASDNADWLTLAPASGSTLAGSSETVTATVDIAGLTAGTRTATITVAAAGLASKTINVTLTIGNALASTASAGVTVSGTTGTNTSQIVTLANAGTTALNWSAASDVAWLTITPGNGTLAGGGQGVDLTLNILSSALAAGTHTGKVSISAPGVATLAIPVTLTLTAPVIVPAKSGNVFVGGTAGVTQLSSLLASRALHKSAAPGSEVLADATVTITLIKPDGTRSVATTRTDSRGSYSLQLDGVAGDTVTVVIEKEGYTSINKTFTLTDADFPTAGSTRQVTVSGQSSQAFTAVVKADTSGAFKASGATTPGFSFGLMRLPDGTHKAYASRSALRKAADNTGGIPELEISIPQTWAPGATALTTRLAAFNPADPEERAMFPGEFKGEGGAIPGLAAKAATGQETYQLESVSFFQTEVTPNDGKPLTATRATGASKAAADPTIITKNIPTSGCEAIKKYKDRDAVQSGVQVPLYTYNPNSGKWGYLGEGTLQTWLAGNYTNVAPASVAGLDGTLSGLTCDTTSYYFRIEATDWYTWWNLDYPLVFAEPEFVTVKGKVVDQDGDAIPGAYVAADGYAYKADGVTPYGANSYHYAYAQNDGTFSFDILTDSTNGKTINNFKFTATNYSDWSTQPVTFVPPAPVNGISNAGNIQIIDRLACTVSGKLTQKNGTTQTPFADAWVWAQNYDYSFYNWAPTDANGSFTMKTTCDEEINVWAWGNAYTVNVNGTAIGIEQSDNSTAVVMNDIVQVNQPPEIWTWYSPYAAKVNQPVELYASAWDLEGDEPLTYQWTITDANGTVVPDAGSNYYTYTWTPSAPGNYTASVTVTDSQGNAADRSEVISVTEFVNSPPIAWTWSDTPTACLVAPDLYVYAYDPDGDVLTYTWEEQQTDGSWSALSGAWSTYSYMTGLYEPTSAAASSYTGSAGGYSDDFSFAAATLPTGQVRLAINDGTATIYQDVTLATAGGLEIYYAEAWPTQPLRGSTVDLYAYAYDNGSIAYSWTVTAPDNSTVTTSQYWTGDNSYVNFTPDQFGIYNITFTAAGTCGSESRTLQVEVPAPPPTTVTANNAYIEYRTHETSANNRYVGWVQYTDNGQPVTESELASVQLLDPSGAQLNPVTPPQFMAANFLNATWNGTSFGAATAGSYTGYFLELGNPASLTAGDYTFRSTLIEGQVINKVVTVGAKVELPVVLSTSMTNTWSGNNLTLSWAEPAGAFDSYRIIVRKMLPAGSTEIFYGTALPGTTSVTIPESLITQVMLNAGIYDPSLEEFGWEVQTRNYVNNSEVARGRSEIKPITAAGGGTTGGTTLIIR